MNIKKLFKVASLSLSIPMIFSAITVSPTLVWAAAGEVQEVSYEDLVNELARKKNVYKKPAAENPLDKIKLHAGLGLVTSANKIATTNGVSNKTQNGFQLSVGIDLFSPEWAAEAALRNFGQATTGNENRTLREFDLKMLNRGPLSGGLGYRAGAGLGTRYLKVEDTPAGVSVNDTTATALFFGGVEAFASKSMSLGLEAGFRTALTNNTADKGSMDLMVRFDTYF